MEYKIVSASSPEGLSNKVNIRDDPFDKYELIAIY